MDSIISPGGSESPHGSNHSVTHLPRLASKANINMAIDPRCNTELLEDKTLYFQSVAIKLDSTEICFMPDPSTLLVVGGTRRSMPQTMKTQSPQLDTRVVRSNRA